MRRDRGGVRAESRRPGARGSHAAQPRSDARDRQRSLRRARDASRDGARAVPAHPADLGIPGPLPRERSDGRLREGVRLLERRDRVVPDGAAQLGADAWASCGWSRATEQKKLYDIHDVAVSVAANSQNGDVTGELVDVGLGTRAEDYAGKDVKGKVAIGCGGVAQIFALASRARRDWRGRLQHAVSRSRRRRDSLVEHRRSNAQGFGWAVSPRQGHELVARLARGEKLSLRSVIKAETMPGELETVHATIAGDPALDAGRHHLRPSLRGLSQAGRERRQLRLRADARGRPRLHQARRRRKAAEAEAHDPLPLGARDQRHQRLAQRASRHRQARRRRSELRHGRHPALDVAQLLDSPAHAGHVPVVPQRHRPEHDGVRLGDHARAHALPRERLRAEPRRPVAQRQRRCVLHQDRQALRLERSRDLHAARHSGRDVHHLARQLVSLVAGHARQAGLRRSTSAPPSSPSAR